MRSRVDSRSGLVVRVIEDLAGMNELAPAWRALVERDGGPALRGPDWLMPWWQAYHYALGASLWMLAVERDGQLVGLAPFYRRSSRLAPGLHVREIRLLGDAGPRPPALDLICQPGEEEEVGDVLAGRLDAEKESWDVIDLQPMREPAMARAYMASRLASIGYALDSSETPGAVRLALAGPDGRRSDDLDATGRFRMYDGEPLAFRKGLASLRRLSRLEWALSEEQSPLADAEAQALLEDVISRMGPNGAAHLARVDGEGDEAIAAGLVIDDGDRAVIIAMAVDPEHKGAAARLVEAEAVAAAERGRTALDVVTGAAEYPTPALPSSRSRALRVRVYGQSTAASLARTAGTVRRKVESARGAPGAAAAGARAAWIRIRNAADTMAGYERMNLYRGELWTRGLVPPDGLSIGLFAASDFEALSASDREILVESLALDIPHVMDLWRRGEVSVLARLHGRPAGIGWCARGQVFVPELERTLSLNASEAYIHEVYVAPQARGRAVAPSMLEFLASDLRGRDVYRSWALIDASNAASSRAFEKAAYVAVAEVLHARMAVVDRLVVRPPDPEAKRLLGLS
jgi:ribosomal protein S18 acetylase RimI-like enzyme